MSSRSRTPVNRPVLIGYCLILACVATAVLCAATAQASYYKMVLCAQGNDAWGLSTTTNTVSSSNPGGIFIFQNQCTASGSYPAGNNAFLRIVENQAVGNAGYGAYGAMSWSSPHAVSIAGAGGYTRVPNAFNDGWRGRFWAEGYDGSANNILMQGSGVANGSCGGVCWATTPSFASHLWPFGGYGHYRRFVFELNCARQAGCDRTNFNAIDANTLVLTLNDVFASRINLTNTQTGILSGTWVRGTQNVTWDVSEEGSGMRFERLRIDGGLQAFFDWRSYCNLDANGAVGEFARGFSPCMVGGPWGRAHQLNTATLTDGAHTVAICSQDYGQAVGLSGSGGESCDQRQVRTDNTAPAAPGGLAIATANPARYLDTFGARWTLPPDPGSPIAKVHYNIVDAAGQVVVAEKTITATNPTKLEGVVGPKAPGEYRLRVWLEDQVGLTGAAATVAIPRDTTPPAAPQEISVASPNASRSDQGFDVRWQNIADAGAPIDALHYQVVDGAGGVVVPTKHLNGANPQAISNLETPKNSGAYTLRLWLSDAEGNVGAPSAVPLSYDCVRSEASGGQALSVGVGDKRDRETILAQGHGDQLGGSLSGSGGPVAGASLCIFARVVTDGEREFIGMAMTGADGSYGFPLGPGPSREITATYRADQRQISATATALTRIKPTLKVRERVVRNKRAAVFYGSIPGPHNDNVVVVWQVKSGKGWRAFRRYRTRSGGQYAVRYRFTQTFQPTSYEIRVQVRRTVGLPYEPGNSRTIRLRVLP